MLQEHGIFIVRVCFQNNSYLSVQAQLEAEFLDVPVLTKQPIKRLTYRFYTTASVDDLPCLGKPHIATTATK